MANLRSDYSRTDIIRTHSSNLIVIKRGLSVLGYRKTNLQKSLIFHLSAKVVSVHSETITPAKSYLFLDTFK